MTNRLELSLTFLALIVCMPAAVAAETNPATISVTGDADVLVTPDEAVVGLFVTTRAKKLDDAVGSANSRIKRVFKALQGLGVAGKHIKTDHLQIWPDFPFDATEARSYRVHQSLSVTVKDVDRLDRVLTSALEAGINGTAFVRFHSTTMRQHRDRARMLAITAAADKANALAGALGMRVGTPKSIQESPNANHGWWGYQGARAQNVIQNQSGGNGSTGESTAVGQIRINAKISVVFEMSRLDRHVR